MGTEEIGGVTTTHFRTKLTTDQLVDLAPEDQRQELLASFEGLQGGGATMDVWVDESGLARMMTMKMSTMFSQDGRSVVTDIDLTLELSDFGVDVSEIVIPTSTEVKPIGEVAELATIAGSCQGQL